MCRTNVHDDRLEKRVMLAHHKAAGLWPPEAAPANCLAGRGIGREVVENPGHAVQPSIRGEATHREGMRMGPLPPTPPLRGL